MVHIAGMMVDNVQCCTRCGYVIADYRGSMVPEGQSLPMGFEDGAHVDITTGNPRYSCLTDEPADCESLQ